MPKRRRNGFKSTLPTKRIAPALRFNDPITRGRARNHLPEMKHHDLISQTINVTSGGVFGGIVLNAVQIGSTAVTRVGNRITIKKLGIRFHYQNVAVTDGGDTIRIIVVLDH